MKKLFSLFFALCFLIGLSSCSKDDISFLKPNDETQSEEKEEKILKLAFSSSDTLNPYECKTEINTQITRLIFDGMFSLNENYEPIPVLAASGITSGNQVNVTLNQAIFSDGSEVTMSDILYSFNEAKVSPVYSEKLKNFSGMNITATNMIMFTLEEPDPYAVSCLDFPIIKKDSDYEFPIGTGRYFYAQSGDKEYLIVNTKKAGFNPIIKKFILESIHDSESVESSLVIGNTAIYYNDLSNGEVSRISAKTVDVSTNSMVYLAFNPLSSVFNNSILRKSVSYAINRNEIITNAFRSHAREAYTPFNPDWYAFDSNSFKTQFDTEFAQKMLSDNEISIDNRQITLLYCKDNVFKKETGEYIAKYLKKLGFSVYVKAYSLSDFTYDYQMGLYDIYIGEVKLSNNMDLTNLLIEGNSFRIDSESETANKYFDFKNEKCELIDFINVYIEDCPIIPICFRNAIVSYTNAITGDYSPIGNDIYCDIDSWCFK